MESDEKPPQAEQSEARISEQPATEGNGIGHAVQEELPQVPSTRKDKGRLHATNHGVLSRYPHEALVRHGENPKTLRKIKRDLLAELKPSGTPGAMFFLFFDRFWSSYLRCLLAAKAEAATSAPIDQPAGESQLIASLKEREVPTLVFPDSSGTSEIHLSADLLRQLALVARYDAHFSREMYRALGILLILRGGGEAALERCYGKILGVNKEA
jgi:hypothetical protein